MSATAEDFELRLRDVQRDAQLEARLAVSRLDSHEAICAERYKTINAALDGFNRNFRWATITLLTGMAAILVKLLFFV